MIRILIGLVWVSEIFCMMGPLSYASSSYHRSSSESQNLATISEEWSLPGQIAEMDEVLTKNKSKSYRSAPTTPRAESPSCSHDATMVDHSLHKQLYALSQENNELRGQLMWLQTQITSLQHESSSLPGRINREVIKYYGRIESLEKRFLEHLAGCQETMERFLALHKDATDDGIGHCALLDHAKVHQRCNAQLEELKAFVKDCTNRADHSEAEINTRCKDILDQINQDYSLLHAAIKNIKSTADRVPALEQQVIALAQEVRTLERRSSFFKRWFACCLPQQEETSADKVIAGLDKRPASMSSVSSSSFSQ